MSGDATEPPDLPPPPLPVAGADQVEGTSECVLPELEPIGQATAAMLIGRALLAVAALLAVWPRDGRSVRACIAGCTASSPTEVAAAMCTRPTVRPRDRS